MAVVTIRGQLGSGAQEIGKLVADKLNAEYVDSEILARVAETLNRREHEVLAKEEACGSFLTRLAGAFGHMDPMNAGSSGPYVGTYVRTCEVPLDDTRYLAGLKAIVSDLATSESVVIRGRGSQFILKNWPGAVHVLLVSPFKLRVRRVMDEMKVDQERAKREIERFDRIRRGFIKRYFKAELDDPLHYDLVINTGHLSTEAAASLVINALPS